MGMQDSSSVESSGSLGTEWESWWAVVDEWHRLVAIPGE
jgi:hypothetical protein